MPHAPLTHTPSHARWATRSGSTTLTRPHPKGPTCASLSTRASPTAAPTRARAPWRPRSCRVRSAPAGRATTRGPMCAPPHAARAPSPSSLAGQPRGALSMARRAAAWRPPRLLPRGSRVARSAWLAGQPRGAASAPRGATLRHTMKARRASHLHFWHRPRAECAPLRRCVCLSRMAPHRTAPIPVRVPSCAVSVRRPDAAAPKPVAVAPKPDAAAAPLPPQVVVNNASE
eukprot:3313568-Prymnesium_polylepis.2